MAAKKTTKRKVAKKKVPKKRDLGQPTKYRVDYARQAEILTQKGFTEVEIANLIGVAESTIGNWKGKHEEFLVALKKGKEISDNQVERALFERAMGYSHQDTHIAVSQGEVIVTPITKHYAPDPTSMIFWLKNRRPKDWRDKQEVEHTGTVTLGEVLKDIDTDKLPGQE